MNLTRRCAIGVTAGSLAMAWGDPLARAAASTGVSDADATITAALDTAMHLPAGEAVRALAVVDGRGGSLARRLDLAAARAGLKIDAELATRPGDFTLMMQRTVGDRRVDAAEAALQRALVVSLRSARQLFAALGIVHATTGECWRAMFADPRYRFATREDALAAMRRTLGAARALTLRLIDPVPAIVLDCDVRALDAAEMAAGRSGYRMVPTRTRPGVYVVDLTDLDRRPAFTLPAVVVHELLPGHMVQLGWEGFNPPHPLRVRYAAAFVEGWGTAVEALADRAGFYQTYAARLGFLHWRCFRLARGLADIRLGGHGDPPDAVVRWLVEILGEPAYFAPFTHDVARMAAMPGQRAAEALAALAIEAALNDASPAGRAWLARLGRRRIEQLCFAPDATARL